MAATKEDVVSFIDNMTVLEMLEFVKELEEKYGVTAAAPALAIAAPAARPSPACWSSERCLCCVCVSSVTRARGARSRPVRQGALTAVTL